MAIPKLLKETREKLKLQNISLGYDADADIAALDIDSHIFLGHEGRIDNTSLELNYDKDENTGYQCINTDVLSAKLLGSYRDNYYSASSDSEGSNFTIFYDMQNGGGSNGTVELNASSGNSSFFVSQGSTAGGGLVAYDLGDNQTLSGLVLGDSAIQSTYLEENTLDFNSAVLSNISNPVDDEDAATKGYVDSALESAGGTFYAIYQRTTYQEILNAYKAGKSIVCIVNGVMFYMYNTPVENSTTDPIYFYSPYSYNQMGERVRYVYLAASNTWSSIYISTLNNFVSSKYYNGETLISSSTGYYRPVRVSMSTPTASDGNVGDIWVVYSNS